MKIANREWPFAARWLGRIGALLRNTWRVGSLRPSAGLPPPRAADWRGRLRKLSLVVGLLASPAGSWRPPAGAEELRPDYGFPQPTITARQLGLAEREVWVLPFSQTSEYEYDRPDNFDRGPHDFDQYVLRLALAGLINRHGPFVWLDMVPYVGGRSSGLAADLEWMEWYRQSRGFIFTEVPGGFEGFLRRVAPLLNGVVLYDYDGHAMPSDNVFLALNLASANACIPVKRDLYLQYRNCFGHLPVVATVDQRGRSRKEIYEWIFQHLTPLMDRTTAHSACISFPDLRQGTTWHYLHGLDYAFRRKCLIFNLTPNPEPTVFGEGEGQVPIDGGAEMSALFARALETITVRPAGILGWGTHEPIYCEKISEAGHYVNCTAAACNLSFHSAVAPIHPPPYPQRTEPRIGTPERKVYLAFVANEGDAIKTQTLMYLRAWQHYPGRGRIPINWALNPAQAREFPALMEYYARTRTDNDYFVGAPCGAGYCVPYLMPDFDSYLRHMADTLPLMDCREAGVWYPNLERIERYFERVPQLRGLDITADIERPMGEELLVTDRLLPVVRFPHKMWYWETHFLRDNHLDIPAFRAQLEEFARARELPVFVNVYGAQGPRVGELADLMNTLDPACFEAVDYATFFHLAREKLVAAGQTVSRSATRQTGDAAGIAWDKAWMHMAEPWTHVMNNAIVDITPQGVRVTVGPGKSWAVVAIEQCRLPESASRVRVRVGPLQGQRARWIFKLYGDLEGFGTRSNWFFESTQGNSETVRAMDPRIREAPNTPWMLQLGLSGEPGDSVLFEAVEFF